MKRGLIARARELGQLILRLSSKRVTIQLPCRQLYIISRATAFPAGHHIINLSASRELEGKCGVGVKLHLQTPSQSFARCCHCPGSSSCSHLFPSICSPLCSADTIHCCRRFAIITILQSHRCVAKAIRIELAKAFKRLLPSSKLQLPTTLTRYPKFPTSISPPCSPVVWSRAPALSQHRAT